MIDTLFIAIVKYNSLNSLICFFGALIFASFPKNVFADKIGVPQDYPTIQEAINNATANTIVVVSPGKYKENIFIKNKSITLASLFYTTNNIDFIKKTVIESASPNYSTPVIIVKNDLSLTTKIFGLTIQNGNDGISIEGKVEIEGNIVRNNKDGIDFESGEGICKQNSIINNLDDGIDLDGGTSSTILENFIDGNKDDGIEIRLHPTFQQKTYNINIKRNQISNNKEDGIQIIGYKNSTPRKFKIEENKFIDNQMVALGFMDNENTVEDYSAAKLVDEIAIVNNSFRGSVFGICGKGNLILKNNIFLQQARGEFCP